jgi:hypothetical protein
MSQLFNIPLKNELEFISDEKAKISYRSRTVASSLIILIIIWGSLSSYVLSFSAVGWKGSLINIPFFVFMVIYYFFQKKYENDKLSCVCVIIGITYMIFIFSIAYILISNIILFGNEVDKIRLLPFLWHILFICLISLILGPFYTKNIINRKIYKKNSKNYSWIIIVASSIGIIIAKIKIGNIFLMIICILSNLIIGLLTMTIVYYLFLYKLLIKHKK